MSSAGEGESLHVSSLGSSEGDDSLLGEGVERDWVDSLLVDEDEAVATFAANALFKVDDFLHALVGEGALGSHQFFALFRRLVEKT